MQNQWKYFTLNLTGESFRNVKFPYENGVALEKDPNALSAFKEGLSRIIVNGAFEKLVINLLDRSGILQDIAARMIGPNLITRPNICEIILQLWFLYFVFKYLKIYCDMQGHIYYLKWVRHKKNLSHYNDHSFIFQFFFLNTKT